MLGVAGSLQSVYFTMKKRESLRDVMFSPRCNASSGDGGSHLLAMMVRNPTPCSDLISRSARPLDGGAPLRAARRDLSSHA